MESPADKYYEILKATHQKVAMRGGFIIVEGREVFDGSKLNEKFRSDQDLETSETISRSYEYDGLSEDGKEYIFYNEKDEEDSISVPLDKLGELGSYLVEDMVCKVKSLEDQIVQIELPNTVEVKVKDTLLHTKNLQIAAHDKKALLENGRTVKVPTYVNTGDVIVMRLPEETFVQRK